MRRVISTLLWVTLFFLMVTHAGAADVAPQGTLAKAAAACPSTSQALCNGWYVGVDVGATGTSGPVDLSGGSGLFGASLGYKYWSGSWLIDGDVEGMYDGTQGSASGLITETVRFGGNLIGIFKGAPSPSQGPMGTTFSNFTPYVLTGIAERVGIGNPAAVGWESGAGVEGPLGGQWTWRTEYKYIKYTSGSLNTEQVGMASVNFHF